MAGTSPLRLQATPAAGAEVVLYTAAAGVSFTTVATLAICNTGVAQARFRIRVAFAGAASAATQSLMDTTVQGGSTVTLTTPITLQAGDVVRVFSDTAGVNFHGYGQETSP